MAARPPKEELSIDKDEELPIEEDEEELSINKEENLERVVQYLCCTAITGAFKELREESLVEGSQSLHNQDLGTRQQDEKMPLEQEKAEREKWLDRTAVSLARDAIAGAYRELHAEMMLSGQNICLRYVSIQNAVTGKLSALIVTLLKARRKEEKRQTKDRLEENGVGRPGGYGSELEKCQQHGAGQTQMEEESHGLMSHKGRRG
ncbi:hypothetical protein Bbelb_270880 [Branchiostoma belcheri]|nr:hypothetical protein Bbelb_270880 [Branchiostoma belcheri]